jgi:hypothetical protein
MAIKNDVEESIVVQISSNGWFSMPFIDCPSFAGQHPAV